MAFHQKALLSSNDVPGLGNRATRICTAPNVIAWELLQAHHSENSYVLPIFKTLVPELLSGLMQVNKYAGGRRCSCSVTTSLITISL